MIEVKPVVACAATSAGSASVSFFVSSLPYFQWAAVIIACVSGILAIMLSTLKLHAWWTKNVQTTSKE